MSPRQRLTTELKINSSRIKVFTYLPVSSPGAGVLLAVHGFRGDHHGLARIVAALPQYTVVVPDLPGFGASTPMDRAHDVPGYIDALQQLCERLGLGAGAHLLGHSFGSILAAGLAARRPFATLSLINPISEPALDSDQALLASLASGFYALCARLPHGAGTWLLRSTLFSDVMSAVMTKSQDPAMRGYVRDQHRRYFGGFHSRRVLVQSYRASIAHTVGQFAPAVSAPTLLIAGELDELGSAGSQQALAERFAAARLVMLQGVGHLIHYERPGPAAVEIAEWIAEHKSDRDS